ncbi:tail fiber assembly protein [Chromobacterium haemolyticum]|uniref:tail fiber assembly protein n=1 Tax=Chromobacterium TaxID=535 RepID=UPI004055E554
MENRFYLQFDKTGKLATRYDVLVHGNDIPDDAIPVEEDVFGKTLSASEFDWVILDGEVKKVSPPALTPSQKKEQDLQRAEFKLKQERAIADSAIMPLQDAFDLKMATDAESKNLAAWRRYRVELSRVPQQPGFPSKIDWPTPPETK